MRIKYRAKKKWFAWFPVRLIGGGDLIWLEFVTAQLYSFSDGYKYVYWEYNKGN